MGKPSNYLEAVFGLRKNPNVLAVIFKSVKGD